MQVHTEHGAVTRALFEHMPDPLALERLMLRGSRLCRHASQCFDYERWDTRGFHMCRLTDATLLLMPPQCRHVDLVTEAPDGTLRGWRSGEDAPVFCLRRVNRRDT